MEEVQSTAIALEADNIPETKIRLGIDEFTVVLQPSEKVYPDEWQYLAEDMTEEFLRLSQIENVLGLLTPSQRQLVQGYTEGRILDDAPYYFCICHNPEQENMGVCIKFSATSWSAYQKAYMEKYNEDMNIVIFLRKAKYENLYKLRLSRIDFTADYFNYPSPFEPDSYLEPDMIYHHLRQGIIKVCDHQGKCNIRTTSALDKDFTHETLYIGSRKGNTQTFLRIYDKMNEQLETHGFRYQEAMECSSWLRLEAVYKGTYAHQISDFFLDENNVITPDILICFIASKMADKYRFMNTTTGRLLNFSEDLVNIASGIAVAPLSCPSPRDNSLQQSLEYIIFQSGLLITLAKACYTYPELEHVESTILNWIEEVFNEFYLPMVNSKQHKNHELWKWLKKHSESTRMQTIDEILMSVKKVSELEEQVETTDSINNLIEKDD